MQKRKFLWIIVVGFLSVFLEAEDLSLSKEDLLVIQNPKGGYHLYIRAKPDIKSVLLTETTKDPDLKLDNYAYRDPNYNEINGDEKRLLNGEFLLPEKRLYSLIDSTPEKNTPLGEAYHIWIPYIILYGYDWSRSGEIEVKDGTFFNIRTFAKPYGDYTGNFQDNPFTLRVTQKPVEKDPPPDLSYSDEAVKTFTDLADTTEGEMIYAKGPEDILSTIKEILKKGEKDHLDLLFALDSTESMKDDVEEVFYWPSAGRHDSWTGCIQGRYDGSFGRRNGAHGQDARFPR